MGMPHCLELAGLLHDMGKATDDFNAYIHQAAENHEAVHRGEINHSSGGAKYVMDLETDSTAVSTLTKELIAYAIAAHHGIFDELTVEGKNKFGSRVENPERIHYEEAVYNSSSWLAKNTVMNLFGICCSETSEILKQITEIVKKMNGTSQKDNFYFLLSCVQRMILSCLIDADRRDTAEFMDNMKQPVLTDEQLIELWRTYQGRLQEKLSSFSVTPLNLLREEMGARCENFYQNGDGIYRLSMPTGSGKTLSVMRYALRLAESKGKKHIIYAAPYLSILEQNAKEYRDIFKDDAHILEHHSNVVREVSESENLNIQELYEDSWDAPVILTTMVRFLNVLFGKDIQDIRRLHSLCDAVIILDEAQSIPVVTIDLFNLFMNYLNRVCHTTIVLCTATQPLFEQTPHNLLLSSPADMISPRPEYEKVFDRTVIIPMLSSGKFDSQRLANFVLENLDESMLIVLNTKSAVRKLYENINQSERRLRDVQVVQLTTLMCPQHRLDVISRMKKSISEGKRIICVSTQLIEAGVDISFENVIRSAAGLDSIAQAAGRCNRNGEYPVRKQVYVVEDEDEILGGLPEIKKAKDAFLGVIDSGEKELLSKQAMNEYYQRYFYARKNEMVFEIPELIDSVYGLLSRNKKAVKEYMRSTGKSNFPYPMGEAFKEAACAFKVIEDFDQISVLVPYNQEAEKMLARLREHPSFEETKSLLKKLQRFSVNLHKNEGLMKTLKGRNAFDDSVLDGSVLILGKAFYSDEVGIHDSLIPQIH